MSDTRLLMWTTTLSLVLFAAMVAAANAAQGAGLGGGLGGLSARFDWNGTPMRMELAPQGKEAVLTREGSAQPVATCQVRNVEQRSDGKAVSADMSCESTTFPALASPAALLLDGPGMKLRTGTWLGGYRVAELQPLKRVPPKSLQ